MNILADGLLVIAALAAMGYCAVLSRRLARLNGLDQGLGEAIVSLSRRVDELRSALADAKNSTEASASELERKIQEAALSAKALSALCERAENVSAQAAAGNKVAAEPIADGGLSSADNAENFGTHAVESALEELPARDAAEEYSPSEPDIDQAPPASAADEPAFAARTPTSLADTLEVIRKARDSDDDEAFAARLATAISSLGPNGAAASR